MTFRDIHLLVLALPEAPNTLQEEDDEEEIFIQLEEEGLVEDIKGFWCTTAAGRAAIIRFLTK